MMKQKKQIVDLLNQISSIITKNNIIKKKQCILISLSGGQDSICIFFILLQLKKHWKFSFGIIYCNHLWQQNGFYASQLVIKLAYLFKIPFYYSVTSGKIFSEYESRYWRYDIFYRLSFFYNYQIISTGHTLSDKVETILFQLMRGTSTKSLTSLNLKKNFLSTNRFSQNNNIKKKYFYNNIKLKKLNIKKTFHRNYSILICLKSTQSKNHYKNKIFRLSSKTTSLLVKKNILNKLELGSNEIFLNKINKTRFCWQFYEKFYYQQEFFKPFKCIQTNKFQSDLLYSNENFKLINHRDYYLNHKNNSYSKKLLNTHLLVRPALHLNRFDFKKLSIFWNLPLYPDKSNQKKYFYRNRIRKQLLPTLRFFFNPQIDTILLQFAEILIAEQTYLDIITNRLKYEFQSFKKVSISHKISSKTLNEISCFATNFDKQYQIFQLNVSLFFGIPLAIQRKLIKQFLENYTTKQIQFCQIEYLLKIMSKKRYFFTFNSVIINRVNIVSCPKIINKVQNLPFSEVLLPFLSLCKVFSQNKLIRIKLNKKLKQQSKKNQTFEGACINHASENIFCSKKNLNIPLRNEAPRKVASLQICLTRTNETNNINFGKNFFNFQKLKKKTSFLPNKKVPPKYNLNLLNKNLASFLCLYNKTPGILLNSSSLQRFKIFFYPEIGILFFFEKKLVLI